MLALHRLIHSLDKGEKRYFKIFTSRHIIHGSRHDTELFDLIAKMKEYDDDELRKQLTNKSLKKNLNIYKHLLYKQLLKAISTYHSECDEEDAAYEQYKIAKILFDKGLYQEGKKNMAQAKAIAKENELFGLMMQMNETETSIQSKIFRQQDFSRVVLDGFADYQTGLEQLTQFLRTRELHNKVFYQTKVQGVRDTKLNAETLKKIEGLELLNQKPKSNRAKLMMWEVQSTIHFLKGEFKASIALEQRVMELMRVVYKNDRIFYNEYLACLVRIAAAHHLLGDLASIKNTLAKVDAVPNINNNIEMLKNRMFINFELIYSINAGDVRHWESVLEKVQKLSAHNAENQSLESEVITQQNLAIFLFMAGQHQPAVESLQFILAYSARKVATDVIISAKLLLLAVLLEQKKFTALKANCDAAKRYISKQRPINDFESVYLDFIRKASKSLAEKAFIKALTKLREQMECIPAAQYSRVFPYLFWVEAKLNGTTLAEQFAQQLKLSKAA